MTNRYEVSDNHEGTVIKIDGYPIQFSMILSDAQIAKYIADRDEQRRLAEGHAVAEFIGG